jgi:hypothetical protein
VHSHGSVVLTSHAPEKRGVAGRSGRVDINELFCGIANELNEVGRRRVLSGLTLFRMGGWISLRNRKSRAKKHHAASEPTENRVCLRWILLCTSSVDSVALPIGRILPGTGVGWP